MEHELQMLAERLGGVNKSLQQKYQTFQEFDRTIKETEGAFVKILDSSQTLLHVLKKEGASLSKRMAATKK